MMGRTVTRWAGCLTAAFVLASCWSHKPGAEFVGSWFDSAGKELGDGRHPPGGLGPLVLSVQRGECNWTAAVFLYLAWPLGSSTTYSLHRYRSFVRDPEGAYSKELQAGFDSGAVLPPGSSATGFHRGKWELWTNPSDEESLYLVSDERVERWPRDHEQKGCL